MYRFAGALVALLVFGAADLTAQQVLGRPIGGPEAEVRAVIEGFSRALAQGDSAAAVSHLHPELVVYEGGHAETLQQYRSHHLGADMAFLQAVEQRTTAERLQMFRESALYTSQYTMRGQYRGRDIDMHGTETLVLVPTPDGWKIRHIHWSSR